MKLITTDHVPSYEESAVAHWEQLREIQAEDDEQSLEGGVEDDPEDPLEDAPPQEMFRDEENQDYSNMPQGHDSLLDESLVHQSPEEPDNPSTRESTDRMAQRLLAVDYDNYERFRQNRFTNPITDSRRNRECNPNSVRPVAEPIPVYRTRRAGIRQHIRPPMRYREDM